MNAVEARLLSLVNGARTSRGIAALRLAPGFTDVARRWSRTMAERGLMYHNPNLVKQVVAAGGGSWRVVAENVGYGYDADSLFKMYMGSSGHRANILSSRHRYIGMGWAERPGGLGYNTQVFVSDYSTSYGRVRFPAYGGRRDTTTPSTTTPIATFERYDPRLIASPASGMAVHIQQPVDDAGDDAVRMKVRETVSGTTGSAGLALRTSYQLSRVRSMTVTVLATTPTRRQVRVDLYARALFGGTDVRVGSVYAPHGKRVRVTLTMPSAARVWRNEIRVVVSKASLNTVSTNLSERYAYVSVYSLVANV